MLSDWMIWAACTGGFFATLYYLFFGFKLPHRKPKQTPVLEDPWATWKKLQVEHRANVAAAHQQWEDEAWAILRKRCTEHVYHNQKWFTCMLCGYEEPWEWADGCKCRYEKVTTLGSPVTQYNLMERRGYCKIHGKDFNSWPVSLRDTPGLYGSDYRPVGDRIGIEKGMALQRTLTGRKIRFMEDIK